MRWKRHPQTVWEVSPDDVVHAVRADKGVIVALEGWGALIWTSDEPDVEALVAELATITGEDAATIDAGVRDFLTDLEQRGLVMTDG
ncbi:PqqD family protein [Aestuariimicrobium ganziense]|uniref:PqqD family protein n=1 Tax=Aestuariimicrobium ganziense TaxID=2773677 RepID=UPI0019451810|nr:PqqD family protein [Aestuariimicrobium ganziense]